MQFQKIGGGGWRCIFAEEVFGELLLEFGVVEVWLMAKGAIGETLHSDGERVVGHFAVAEWVEAVGVMAFADDPGFAGFGDCGDVAEGFEGGDEAGDAVLAGFAGGGGYFAGRVERGGVAPEDVVFALCDQIGIEMAPVGREGEAPAWVERLSGGGGVEAGDFGAGEIVGEDEDRGVGFLLPDFVGDCADEIEFVVVEVGAAVGAVADGVVGGFDEEAIGVGVEVEEHFFDVLAHEAL